MTTTALQTHKLVKRYGGLVVTDGVDFIKFTFCLEYMGHYAYRLADGRAGITDTWTACERIVHGASGAAHKKFKTQEEAQAWIDGTVPRKTTLEQRDLF